MPSVDTDCTIAIAIFFGSLFIYCCFSIIKICFQAHCPQFLNCKTCKQKETFTADIEYYKTQYPQFQSQKLPDIIPV
jgi:hypothetical protein